MEKLLISSSNSIKMNKKMNIFSWMKYSKKFTTTLKMNKQNLLFNRKKKINTFIVKLIQNLKPI